MLKEFQGIEETNFFRQDPGLASILGTLLPPAQRDAVFSQLDQFGSLVAGRWNDLAREGADASDVPKILKYDRVGNRLERVDLGSATRQLRREVAESGLLTRDRSDLHRFAMVYLLAHNGEASLTCPISCTDGLIRAVESRGSDFLRSTYLATLRSAEVPFGGAQFVTERSGGSDVGAIETSGSSNGDGTWRISGEKWFCSNPDEFYLVAAKVAGAPAGTRGIGVFLVPRLLPDGSLNRISLRRLKDKLGTRSLPTAEIDFEGATGYSIGDPADGFRTLMNYVINVSRVHNAANACGFLHRAFLEARNYARQREAFGARLVSYPAIQETLVRLLETLWRNRLLTFRLAALMDRHGICPGDEEQAMWQRFLINLAKYRTAVTLTDSIREAILILGGNGIVEDFTILPRLLRDAMIIETWEGPHNTLCLQIVRDAGRSNLLERWHAEIRSAVESWPRDLLCFTRLRFEQALREMEDAMASGRIRDEKWAAAHARRFVDRMGVLLEIAWMAQTSALHSSGDASVALLAAAARYRLLPSERLFDHPVLEVILANAIDLIDESPVQTDVAAL
jgi:acyl-CoA dehydrogenase